MNELIKLELIDLAEVELREALAEVTQKDAKLLPVVRANEFERGSARRFGIRVGLTCVGHMSTVAPRLRATCPAQTRVASRKPQRQPQRGRPGNGGSARMTLQ